MFKKQYEIVDNPPALINWDIYERKSIEEYQVLLATKGDDEKIFQNFFECNPSFMLGAFQLFGTSGHYPHTQSLITEPELDSGLFRRYPDFIWLAQNSLNFTPVLIEIEKPNKRTFTESGIQTSEFTQALNQIIEWKMMLKEPENILMFYKCFNIPDYVREKTFSPQYGLVYGRRSEYDNNTTLRRKRAELVPDNVLLMSYDRLHPSHDYKDFLCCKLNHGKYTVLTIPPTYQYRPHTADNLSTVDGFYEAIYSMKSTSEERKEFLRSRYSYWLDYGQSKNKGIIYTSDRE
jgi:hypothetical protein